MTPSQDYIGMLLECVRSAWEGPEEAASCVSRFLASVAKAGQEEQLLRVLSFAEAMRGALLERLKGEEGGSGGKGLVEQASRKRARCDVEREQEDEQGEAEEVHPGLSGQAVIAPAVAPESEDVAMREGMSRAGKGVLLDGDLLECVWGFVLGGNGRQDVGVLGQLSLVCRKWREVSLWDAWWGAIEQDMLPVLWEEGAGEKVGSSRGRVLQYGRFVDGQRALVRELDPEEWVDHLQGHVEVFDSMDGLQLWSMRGPFSLYEDEGGTFLMDICGDEGPNVCKPGADFSAASRDPLGRFSSIEHYLEDGHKKMYPCCLCIRLTVRDMRTGRMAIIWEEEANGVERQVDYAERETIVASGQGCLGESQENLFGRFVRQDTSFVYLSPVPNQGADVSQRDRLYYIDSKYGLEFRFRDPDVDGCLFREQVREAFRAALTWGQVGTDMPSAL